MTTATGASPCLTRRTFLRRSLLATVAAAGVRALPVASASAPVRIVDAHVHVVERAGALGPFPDMGSVDQLLRSMDAAAVDKAIMLPYVSERTPENNERCASHARQHPDRLATLTDVPLHAADAAAQVARARETHGAVGISYYPPTPGLGWLATPSQTPLWQAFQAHDLVCNLQITPRDYPVLLELCTRHPEVRFVINHMGLPGTLTDGDDYDLLQGAACPNLFVKASAFYACAGHPWNPYDARALGYLARLLAGLGPSRLLWGSDWPPSGWHLTYRQTLEIVSSAAGLNDEERRLILGANAARVYRV